MQVDIEDCHYLHPASSGVKQKDHNKSLFLFFQENFARLFPSGVVGPQERYRNETLPMIDEVKGVYIHVSIAEVYSPGKFYLQKYEDKNLDNIENSMQ